MDQRSNWLIVAMLFLGLGAAWTIGYIAESYRDGTSTRSELVEQKANQIRKHNPLKPDATKVLKIDASNT